MDVYVLALGTKSFFYSRTTIACARHSRLVKNRKIIPPGYRRVSDRIYKRVSYYKYYAIAMPRLRLGKDIYDDHTKTHQTRVTHLKYIRV